VNLVIDSRFPLKVTGTVGGKPLDAKGPLYGGTDGDPASVTGSLAGRRLDARLSLKDQVPDGTGYQTTARLTASVGDVAITVSGSFRLNSSFAFVDGNITGSDRALKVAVTAAPSSSSVYTGNDANFPRQLCGCPGRNDRKSPQLAP
jgi:hypothetical protein